MTVTAPQKLAKLIHAARFIAAEGRPRYLFLRQEQPRDFVWLEELDEKQEVPTEVSGSTIEEAIRLAHRHWRPYAFRTVICGFRYTLPERDEHGINALFHQMISSYSSMNGVYYDEELGNNCFVQSASDEAYRLWQRLKNQNRV